MFSGVPVADQHPFAELYQMNMTYANEGYYTVNAIARNAKSTEYQLLSYSISGLDCVRPDVDIHNRSSIFLIRGRKEVFKKKKFF